MTGSFHKVKIIHINRGPQKDGEKEEIIFFYGKVATLRWDPERWWWIDEGRFLDYTTKIGIDFVINKNSGTTRTTDKCQATFWLKP